MLHILEENMFFGRKKSMRLVAIIIASVMVLALLLGTIPGLLY